MAKEKVVPVLVRAYEIIRALARRHKEDMFFTEVKDGATVTRRHSRIDALAMKISWSSPLIVGYEVKVSRSDFMGDHKWTAYLSMCHQLYFVVAPGVCEAHEVPDPCGLMIYNPKTKSVRVAKKAGHRNIDDPADMYKYLMFTHIGPLCRFEQGYHLPERLVEPDRIQAARDYIDAKASLKEIGRQVGIRLSKEVADALYHAGDFTKMRDDNVQLNKQLREMYNALGVNAHWRGHEHALAEIARLKESGVPKDLKENVESLVVIARRLQLAVTAEGK